MRILITGGSGFIGTHLVRLLKDKKPNAEVTIVTRGLCDLSSENDVAHLIEQTKPDKVCHLAGISRVHDTISFPDYFNQNFLSTVNLLQALKTYDKTVRFFLASSVHIYGNQQGVVDENSPARPASPYGFSKYLAEEAVKNAVMQNPMLEGIVGRLYNVIGPGQRSGFVVTDFCEKISKLPRHGGRLQTGSLSAVRCFLDVRDAVEILEQILFDLVLPTRYEIYNIASSHEHTMQSILDKILAIAGKTADVDAQSRPTNPFVGPKVSVQRLHKVFSARHRSIEQTLKDTYHLFDSKAVEGQ